MNLRLDTILLLVFTLLTVHVTYAASIFLTPDLDLEKIVLGPNPISETAIDLLFKQAKQLAIQRREAEELSPKPTEIQLHKTDDTTSPKPFNDIRNPWQFLSHDKHPTCETSSSSPLLNDAIEFLEMLDDTNDKEIREWCDQANRWRFGSHCTTLWTYKSVRLGVCGTVSERKVRCRIAILSFKKIVAMCAKDGRVGGWERYRYSPGDDERIEHKAIIF